MHGRAMVAKGKAQAKTLPGLEKAGPVYRGDSALGRCLEGTHGRLAEAKIRPNS
jgi:hypothetical protein